MLLCFALPGDVLGRPGVLLPGETRGSRAALGCWHVGRYQVNNTNNNKGNGTDDDDDNNRNNNRDNNNNRNDLKAGKGNRSLGSLLCHSVPPPRLLPSLSAGPGQGPSAVPRKHRGAGSVAPSTEHGSPAGRKGTGGKETEIGIGIRIGTGIGRCPPVPLPAAPGLGAGVRCSRLRLQTVAGRAPLPPCKTLEAAPGLGDGGVASAERAVSVRYRHGMKPEARLVTSGSAQ